MSKVILSDLMRAILKDRTAREQLSMAMQDGVIEHGAGRVTLDGKTYRVIDARDERRG